MKTFMYLASVAAVTLAASAAQGAIVQYSASLNGPSESPPNQSPATGSATFAYDTDTHSLTISIIFSGLVGTTTVAGVHAGTVLSPGNQTSGVAYFMDGWATGLQSGSYTSTIDLLSPASYNPEYLAAHGGTTASAIPDLIYTMGNGSAYLNLRTTAYTDGEIRGFIYQVPAPGMFALIGMCGVLTGRRRR